MLGVRLLAALALAYAMAALTVEWGGLPSSNVVSLAFADDETLLRTANATLAADPARGVAEFQALLARDPASPRRWADLADAYDLSHQRPVAAACYQTAVAASPVLASTLVRAFHFHVAAGNTDEALSLTTRVLRIAPTYQDYILDLLVQTNVPPKRVLVALSDNPTAARSYVRRLTAADSFSEAEEASAWLERRSIPDRSLTKD